MNDKRDELRKARKPHLCTLCGERIEAGEHYHYTRVTPWDHPDNEGYFDYRAHEDCDAFWSEEYGVGVDWEFPYGAARSDFAEQLRYWQAEEFDFWLVRP
jgi:hypothetical protein